MSTIRAAWNLLALVTCLLIHAGVCAAGPSAAAEGLRLRLVATEMDPLHAGIALGDRRFLVEFYSRREYRPLWSDAATSRPCGPE